MPELFPQQPKTPHEPSKPRLTKPASAEATADKPASSDQELHSLSILTPADKQTPEYQKMRERIDAVKAEMKRVSEDQSLTKAQRMKIIAGELMAKLEKAQRFKKPKDKFAVSSELFEKLDIETQYNQRHETLSNIGLLEKLSTGQEGIVGIDGKEYPMPTIEEIKARIVEKEAMLETKIEQGFTKLILVPFAAKLSNLTKSYSDTIKKKALSARRS